jgi:hypothetical protein
MSIVKHRLQSHHEEDDSVKKDSACMKNFKNWLRYFFALLFMWFVWPLVVVLLEVVCLPLYITLGSPSSSYLNQKMKAILKKKSTFKRRASLQDKDNGQREDSVGLFPTDEVNNIFKR